jgi:hypothetical protein
VGLHLRASTLPQDPEEADYFLVPTMFYHSPTSELRVLIEEVLRVRWPYWDR